MRILYLHCPLPAKLVEIGPIWDKYGLSRVRFSHVGPWYELACTRFVYMGDILAICCLGFTK